ncbi:hypothetical protein DY023_06555 [Microbacterium bovistercoris]|uniref:Phage major capsid protein n=1 Tax=Microbacterium bovistercoris TaxID=2293570 RepID=A0A371NUZ2_9MICO|nr:hypothetical protein [Microbacterium bovistercoris]REJ06286.1 hypothetical protein DY023_06555 [Microbacterium bovistercoris]
MNMTEKDFTSKAAQHTAQARAISNEFEGKSMPAEAAKQMQAHLQKAGDLRRQADLAKHEAWLAEPQYKHDMLGGNDFDATPATVHPLAMPNDLPGRLATSTREGKTFQWRSDLESKAALTTSDTGTSTTFVGTSVPAGLLLHSFAGVAAAPLDGIDATFPTWTTPTAATGVAEGAAVTEYADVVPGTSTAKRYGRWTELNAESELSLGTGDLLSLHRLGIARDLNVAFLAALKAAHGTITAFATDAEHMLRLAIATVASQLGIEPTAVTVAINAADYANLGFAPTSGADVATSIVRFAGAKLFVTPAVTAGEAVAFAGMAAKYHQAKSLEILTDRDVKTAVWSVGSHVIGGYGVGLPEGVSYVDLAA